MPEEIVGKLRQVEVLVGQGKPVAEAIPRLLGSQVDVLPLASRVWRAEAGLGAAAEAAGTADRLCGEL